MKLIDHYNWFYNDECSSLPHGTPIAVEHIQAIAIESMVKAFACKYNPTDSIPVSEILELASQINEQGDRTVEKAAQGLRKSNHDDVE